MLADSPVAIPIVPSQCQKHDFGAVPLGSLYSASQCRFQDPRIALPRVISQFKTPNLVHPISPQEVNGRVMDEFLRIPDNQGAPPGNAATRNSALNHDRNDRVPRSQESKAHDAKGDGRRAGIILPDLEKKEQRERYEQYCGPCDNNAAQLAEFGGESSGPIYGL